MRWILPFTLIVFAQSVFAQNLVGSARLVSEVDQGLTLKRVAVAPAQDNVDGLYAKPLTEHLIYLVDQDTQFNIAPLDRDEIFSPEGLQETPAKALELLKEAQAQGLISLRIERGVRGTSLILGLSTLPEGRILLNEKTEPLSLSDVNELRDELTSLYGRMKSRIPYGGLVMSRRGNEITVNLGKVHNVRVGETLDIIQVIDVDRHPRFDFLIATDKTVIGTAEVTKVDDALAFAIITKERAQGVIDTDAKVDRRNFIEYEKPRNAKNPSLNDRSDKNVAFGNNPEEWVPVSAPTFGSATFYLGLGTYTSNIDISSDDADTDDNHSGQKQFAPNIGVDAEIWINPLWSLMVYLDQSVFTIENPISGGSPNDIHFSLNRQGLLIGYNFLLTENFFGPKLQLLAGLGSSQAQSDTSRPMIFGTTTYSGIHLGIRGDMDIPTIPRLRVGASLTLLPVPTLITKPEISGDESSTITQFRIFGTYKMGERFQLYSGLDFQSYATSFSGSKQRPDDNSINSHSQRFNRLLFGAQYMF